MVLAAAYQPVGIAHAVAGVAALGSGAVLFAGRKGTAVHVRVGWVYVGAMAWVDGSALLIRRLTGRFNLFHALAVLSLAMVCGGVGQVILRRGRRWLWRHYQYMCWSYVGLLAATANEACVRVPALRSLTAREGGWPPLVASGVIVAGAAAVIALNQRRVLAPFGGRGGDEGVTR